MDYNNKYVKEWENAVLEMGKAINEGDFSKANVLKESVNEAFDKCGKYDSFYKRDDFTFGELNHLIRENYDEFFLHDKKLIKEYMNLLKEDKNLAKQYNAFSSMNGFNGEEDSRNFISEAISFAKEGINPKTMDESTEKIVEMLMKHEVLFENNISDEEKKFYENCDYMFRNRKNLTNLNESSKRVSDMAKFIDEHKKTINEENNMAQVFERFINNMDNVLSEDDKKLIKTVISPNTSESEKRDLYAQVVSECNDKLDGMMEGCDDETKERLTLLKEKIASRPFSEETFLKDITKVMKIKNLS